ncbi:MAG: c-type cytochrome [Gammaproteobacteria bacterium]|nr:c-type cytochrome [Gammaproteobacteria bacterium]MDH5650542.1 c-type cytochrome [Gammaproteobacteria bacterium]
MEIGSGGFVQRPFPVYLRGLFGLEAAVGGGRLARAGPTDISTSFEVKIVSHDDDVFMRTFWSVMAGLLVLMFVIIVTARMVSKGETPAVSTDPRVMANIDKRIEPVGKVRTGKVEAQAAGGDAKGDYMASCNSCHGSGVLGAPKLGDKAAWKPRIAKGKNKLYTNALKGFKQMPAKGGNAGLSDKVVKDIVDYMIKEGK